jgi:iron complex transport system substrate-binding protein
MTPRCAHGLLVLLLLFITACQSSASPSLPATPATVPSAATASSPTVTNITAQPAQPNTPQPVAPTTAASAQTTRTITDATGQQVEIPTDPQRVITLSEQDLDAALALDVKPIASVNGRGQSTFPMYLNERTAGIESVGSFTEPSIEKIVTLKPDLILIGGIFPRIEGLLPQLREIAPVVVTYKLEDDWKTAFKGTAAALSRETQADTFLSAYDQEVQEMQAAFGSNARQEVSIIRWSPEGPAIMAPESFSRLVAADLGLKRPEAQQSIIIQPGHLHTEPLSLEQLNQIDADWVFIGTLNPEGVTALDSARQSPLFQQLNAAKNNRVVDVDGTIWTSRGGPLAALIILEDIRRAFNNA